MIGNNFRQFLLDELRIQRLSSKPTQHFRGLVDISFLDEISWGFGQEEKTGGQDDSGKHLQGDWDAIRAGVGPILSAIVDARGEQYADSNAELVARDDCSTNLPRGNLGHVQNDDGGHKSDPEPGNETTGNQDAQRGGRRLEDDTDEEDSATSDDGGAATDKVGQVTCDDGAEEGAGGEDGDDQRFFPIRQNKGILNRLRGIAGRFLFAGVLGDEVRHCHDAADVSGVITEKDTAKGGKDTHEVGFDGDRRLDARGVGRGNQSSARHCEGLAAVQLRSRSGRGQDVVRQ